MNIKQAKEQLKNTIKAYLHKNEFGEWSIPIVAQRPILLMGPPGVGKTAIAAQVAQECNIALVSYTITHHTRQSAIGLPSIQSAEFNGSTYKITEYTMSEIVASVYEKIKSTGLQNGILFIDEINCVSETLAPAMLQFLQCKTFGCHQVPEGWIIIAAGNPPEYNRSVRNFDIVTLDRVRKIDISQDFKCWKEYAYERKVHPAVISYLEIKPQNFYKIESTVDGKKFVTARGWEDLSRFIAVAETLSIPLDETVVGQYLQYPSIAKDFANYYDLYLKYKADYRIDEILNGNLRESTITRLQLAQFDERLSAVSLLLDAVFNVCDNANNEDTFVTELFVNLKELLNRIPQANDCYDAFDDVLENANKALDARVKTGNLSDNSKRISLRVIGVLEDYKKQLQMSDVSQSEQAANMVRQLFQTSVQRRRQLILDTSAMLDNAFSFMEKTFGDSQEMVIFVTELTMNVYSMQFIRDNGCKKYSYYNQSLLLGGRQKSILDELQ